MHGPHPGAHPTVHASHMPRVTALQALQADARFANLSEEELTAVTDAMSETRIPMGAVVHEEGFGFALFAFPALAIFWRHPSHPPSPSSGLNNLIFAQLGLFGHT